MQNKKRPLCRGLETLGHQLDAIYYQLRLYADVAGSCTHPGNDYLQTPVDAFCNTMYHFTERVDEARESVQDLLNFILKQ